MATAWGSIDVAARDAEWEPELRRFSHETLNRAFAALKASGKEWPPTLPEFIGLCREFNRAEARPALEYKSAAGVDVAQKFIDRAKQAIRRDRDPMLDEPIQDGVVGTIQRVYAAESRKWPNKQWACRHLLRFAGGGEMKAQQLEMSARAVDLNTDDIAELRAVRESVKQMKYAA